MLAGKAGYSYVPVDGTEVLFPCSKTTYPGWYDAPVYGTSLPYAILGGDSSHVRGLGDSLL